MSSWLDRLFCGLTSHRTAMLQSGDGRLWLSCPECGWRSKGWQVTKPDPPRRVVPFEKKYEGYARMVTPQVMRTDSRTASPGRSRERRDVAAYRVGRR